jgi:isoquinoline 1-oxidoreductase alpha subunit
MPTNFVLNGRSVKVDVPDDTPLLWVLRDDLRLTGTKFGCGIGMCGACTVHLNGQAIRSCVTPLAAAASQQITTIEGLKHTALQQAWIEHQAPQCGYCQSGQIMQAASLLRLNPNPSDAEITNGMNGNLCRCMAYVRIRKAVKAAAARMQTESGNG